MALDMISQVSNVLLHPAVIVFNTILMIGQALTIFSRPGIYI